MTTALWIPPDPEQPCELVELGPPGRHKRAIESLLGSEYRQMAWDADVETMLQESGELHGRALNFRLNQYLRFESQAAQEGAFDGVPGAYGVRGYALLTGAEVDHQVTDVPDRMIERFEPVPDIGHRL
jgi:hypothetical protein